MEFDRAPFVRILTNGTARALVRTGGRPIEHYAVMLQVIIDGHWLPSRGDHPLMADMTEIRPAGRDAATEAMIAAVLADEDRYPNGVSFVGRDDAGFETIVARLVDEGATFVVVARDGSETLYAPTHA